MKNELDGVVESRIETIRALMIRFENGLRILGGEDALVFSTPLVDLLLRAVGQLNEYEARKRVDELLNNVLNPEGSDTTDGD